MLSGSFREGLDEVEGVVVMVSVAGAGVAVAGVVVIDSLSKIIYCLIFSIFEKF